jgi:hypothetical protein
MASTVKLPPQINDEDNKDFSIGRVISNAKVMMNRISWLSPSPSLDQVTSSEFGRNIERALNDLSKHNGIINLVLRRKTTAVVISIQHYEQLLEMKEVYAKLIEIESERTVSDAIDDFRSLYGRITSQESAKASDLLFSAGSEELSKSYRPGATEQNSS